jgi:4-amino-4-deoxy-L-arabinose transferase-like glycosyltransferase
MTSLRGLAASNPLATLLAAGLLVRIVVLTQTTTLGTPIIDEQHYSQIAGNLLAGHGFAWGPGQPTSIRPPLYPAFLASLWSITGPSLQAVRVVQIGLAALTSWLVYLIGRTTHGAGVGRAAAVVVWLYPSLVFFNFTILTETLYTCLLMAFVLFTVKVFETSTVRHAAFAGVALGLACLTRSSLWPLPLILCPLVVLAARGSLSRRLTAGAVVFVGYAVVVAPWAVRNTQLQGVVTIVDTMGGLNLRLGNYEYTPEDRMWDAVSLTGERSWSHALAVEAPGRTFTEGEKDKWAQKKALEFMASHPGITLRRSLIRFADFWGLEREYAAGISQGFFFPPVWFGTLSSVLMVLSFALVAAGGVAGIWLAPPHGWRMHMGLLLAPAAIMAAHTIAFGHSRYHVPLVPILAIYAAAFTSVGWAKLDSWRTRAPLAAAVASVLVLATIWVRQVLVVDAERIRRFFTHVL